MSPLKAIAFDLDDTLFPERDYAFSGFGAVAEWAEQALGLEAGQAARNLRGYFDSGVRGDTFNRLLHSHGLPVEPWLKEMIRVCATPAAVALFPMCPPPCRRWASDTGWA
jgi:putative hydrolase of the HAD superfamily